MAVKKIFSRRLSVFNVLTLSLVLGITAVAFYSCDEEGNGGWGISRLFMVGTADPAASGAPLVMEQITFREILRQGETGIATFEAGEGEAIGVDGEWWLVDSNGDVARIELSDTTVFGASANFVPDNSGLEVSDVECTSTLEDAIDDFIDEQYPEFSTDLYWFLILVEADLETVTWVDFNPSVAPEEEAESLFGTILGLRTPTYAESFGEAPYHFHFVSDNRKLVGHIESCTISSGMVFTQIFRKLKQVMPDIEDN